MKTKQILTILILTQVLTLPAGASVEEDLNLAANLAEMKAHINAAVQQSKEGNPELASAHAGHPSEEYWPLIAENIKQRDSQLFSKLDKNLAELPELAKTLSPQEFEAKASEAITLLEEAETLIPEQIREGFIFKTKLITKLLEKASTEYTEGISQSGEVMAEEEYQDAIAFIQVAEELYTTIETAVDAEENQEIKEFFEQLKDAAREKKPPSTIETLTEGITRELEEVTGITEASPTGPAEIIRNIQSMLNKISKEYREGEYSEAEELAIKAYLENFEFVETELGKRDESLNEELEHLLRVQLRELIKNRAPPSEIDSLTSEISEKLEKAERLLEETPERSQAQEMSQTTPPPTQASKTAPVWYAVTAVLLLIVVAEAAVIAKLKKEK